MLAFAFRLYFPINNMLIKFCVLVFIGLFVIDDLLIPEVFTQGGDIFCAAHILYLTAHFILIGRNNQSNMVKTAQMLGSPLNFLDTLLPSILLLIIINWKS